MSLNTIRLKAQIARALLANHYALARHIIEVEAHANSTLLTVHELDEYYRKAKRLDFAEAVIVTS